MKKKSIFIVLSLFGLLLASPLIANPSANTKGKAITTVFSPKSMNLKEVFSAAPIIYSSLLLLSIGAFSLWAYTLFSLRKKDVLTPDMIRDLRDLLSKKDYQAAHAYCEKQKTLLTRMVSAGLGARHHGTEFMVESIKAEGKRATAVFWQRVALLNDVILVAPMLGLLGTVLGMFYAFYDINRSAETLSCIFDGLGLSLGSTVAGLIVAITAVVFYTTLKHRLFQTLNALENEVVLLSTLIDTPKKGEKS
ncbi:MAG: MotA/TolQ/ExbB proton channel family protein [Chlamydiota bacterium]